MRNCSYEWLFSIYFVMIKWYYNIVLLFLVYLFLQKSLIKKMQTKILHNKPSENFEFSFVKLQEFSWILNIILLPIGNLKLLYKWPEIDYISNFIVTFVMYFIYIVKYFDYPSSLYCKNVFGNMCDHPYWVSTYLIL